MESALWPLAALMLVTSPHVFAADQTVKIFHLNDLRYDIFQVKDDGSIDCVQGDPTCFGGLLRLQQLVDTEILSAPPDGTTHLWLDAGLDLGPSPAYDVLKFDMAPALRNLNFHASALGPEVFTYGVSPSNGYMDQLNETLVASNLRHDKVNVSFSVIVPLGGECSAAIVGFVDKNKTDSLQVFGVEIEEEVKAITEEIASIKKNKPDKKMMFISLGSSSIEMAKRIAGIVDVDVVVFSGGNFSAEEPKLNYFESVTVKLNATANKTNHVVSVIKNPAKLEERFLVGTLEFALDSECRVKAEAPVAAVTDYVLVNETTNQESVDVVMAARDMMLSLSDVATHSKVPLLPVANSCKVAECALGDLIADAVVEKLNELTADKAWAESIKLAVVPAHMIRSQINVTGAITSQQLRDFFAQDEYLYTAHVTGKGLKRMFEAGIVKEGGSTNMENYLQVSEYLHVEFNFARNEVVKIDAMSSSADAMTLTSVDIHNDVIKYVIAMPACMLFNTSAFDFLRQAGEYEYFDATVADALLSHVSKSSASFLTLPLTGMRTKQDPHVTELCVSNTGEVIILTLFVLALIVAFVVGLWKYVLPKYRRRRGSTTQLIP